MKFINTFHGTEINLRAKIGDHLTDSQIRRAKHELCPSKGCTCGGAIGERGGEHRVEDCGWDNSGRRLIRVAA